MNAVMYRGIGQIAVEQIEKPEMHANEYLVEVLYSGLCGTDIKTYKQGHRMFTPPCVLGHEFSGRIIEAGADMDPALIGKKVVVAPYIGCGECAMCKSGFEELCTTWPKPHTEGAFTEFLTVDADMVKGGMLVLDDDMDEKVMTLAEPFACILNSMGKSQVKAGQNALVIGAGPMGLLHIEGLKMAGAKNIIVSEYNDTRCKVAEGMGAKIINYDDSIRIIQNGRLRRTTVKTRPYPGFPTDMQAQICVCMALASGVSRLTESVYETRFFGYCTELESMGANIQVSGKTATVVGVENLYGASVCAHDLRAGAALVIAGLSAQGSTQVEDIHFIERGYETLIEKMTALGADIRRVED